MYRAIRVATLAALAALAVLTAAELWSKGPLSKLSGRTRNAELAIAEMTRGRYAARFWGGGIAVGMVFPALLLAVALGVDGVALPAIAAVLIVGGLFWYEDAFVGAGQAVPLS